MKTWIPSQDLPLQCMSCHHPFNTEKLSKIIQDTIKIRYRAILFDKEKRRMPLNQAQANNFRKHKDLSLKLKDMKKVYKEKTNAMLESIKNLDIARKELKNRDSLTIDLKQSTLPPILDSDMHEKWFKLSDPEKTHLRYELVMKENVKSFEDLVKNRRLDRRLFNQEIDQVKLELKSLEKNRYRGNNESTYERLCLNPVCNAYVDNTLSCQICSKSYCHDCEEETQEGHLCNPETKLSIQELKNTSKPCPSCFSPVTKIEGCPQMWCVAKNCGAVFDWTTGKRQYPTRIHNPEYFRHLRLNGLSIEEPYNPYAIHLQLILIRPSLADNEFSVLWFRVVNFYNCIQALDTRLESYRKEPDNEWMRMLYLSDTISEKQFIDAIVKEDKEFKMLQEAIPIMTDFRKKVANLFMLFHSFATPQAFVDALLEQQKNSNEQLETLRKSYYNKIVRHGFFFRL